MQARTRNSRLASTAGVIAACSILVLSAAAQSVPSLINYQGKLTDQNGNTLSAGVYGIQFRIWDSATATGTNDLIWAQQQNATIQSNGVFNAILGSPGGSPILGAAPAVNNLAYAFTGSNCFLGVKIVVSNGTPIASPSEILPRQQLLSVPFAITAASAASVVPGAIGSVQIAPGSVQSSNLAQGVVTLTNLAPRPFVVTNSAPPVGAVSASLPSPSWADPDGNEHPVPGLAVNVMTTGRPVLVETEGGYMEIVSNKGTNIILYRDGAVIGNCYVGLAGPGGVGVDFPMPLRFVDNPPSGLHNYYVTVSAPANPGGLQVVNVRLVALEL